MLKEYFFFFNDTATTEIYTLSLHDALPISLPPPARARDLRRAVAVRSDVRLARARRRGDRPDDRGSWRLLPRLTSGRRSPRTPRRRARSGRTRCGRRSEEHTSELQSPCNLV